MKTYKCICLVWIFFASCITAHHFKPTTVRWAYDEWRTNNAAAIAEENFYEQFKLTNKDPQMGVMIRHFKIPIPTEGIEQGFRSDGVMVWRYPPEGHGTNGL